MIRTPLASLLFLAACGGGAAGTTDGAPDAGPPAAGRDEVALPGVSGPIAFDDLYFSAELGQIVSALRSQGVALVDPDTLEVTVLGGVQDAGSAAAGGGLVLVADRGAREVVAIDPASGDRVASATTAGYPDYVRYLPDRGEVWVTEPGSGIEIFRLETDPPDLTRLDSVATAGPEGIVVSPARGLVYTHGSGAELVAIDAAAREVVATWPYDCSGSHGIPALDDERGLLLAGCGTGGEVHLLDIDGDGADLGGAAAGGGAPLMGFSSATGHFAARGDPGRAVAILSAATDSIASLATADGSDRGHCLTGDDRGHFWTADTESGHLVRIDDSF